LSIFETSEANVPSDHPGHHAKWRELSEDEETAAVAEFRALAGGRAG
jgi:hypothetical protein